MKGFYHRIWVLTDGHDEALMPRAETVRERMTRCDTAVRNFLASSRIVEDSHARVSHADFAAALKEHLGLRGLSQHAISQAAGRAGLKCLPSLCQLSLQASDAPFVLAYRLLDVLYAA
jgi:hypothetical protein